MNVTYREEMAWAEARAKLRARHYSQCPGDQADFVQAARIKAHKLITRPEGCHRAILTTAIYNAIKDEAKKLRGYRAGECAYELLTVQAPQTEDDQILVDQIFKVLTPAEAYVIEKNAQGYTTRQIGKTLNVAGPTVSARISKAVAHARNVLVGSPFEGRAA